MTAEGVDLHLCELEIERVSIQTSILRPEVTDRGSKQRDHELKVLTDGVCCWFAVGLLGGLLRCPRCPEDGSLLGGHLLISEGSCWFFVTSPHVSGVLKKLPLLHFVWGQMHALGSLC